MRRQHVTVVSVVMAVFLSSVGLTRAGKWYVNRQCTTNRSSVPMHNYGHDTPRFGVTKFAVANAVVGQGAQRHKPFDLRALALKVDQLTLDQVGLAIYADEGKMVASGRITAGVGDGGLIGNNVIIHIRAYVASSPDPVRIPPDAVVVWETQRHLWVSRGRPQSISLVQGPEYLTQSVKSNWALTDPSRSTKLTRHFDDITHLEVELEWERDR